MPMKVYIVYDSVNHLILGCFRSFESATDLQETNENFTVKELFLID